MNSVQYARLLTASGISGKKTTEHEDDDENWFRVVGHVCVCLVEWPSMTLALSCLHCSSPHCREKWRKRQENFEVITCLVEWAVVISCLRDASQRQNMH